MKLTAHFTDAELGAPPELLAHAVLLAAALEEVRAVVGAPVRVVSGYRTPERNAAVGGAPSSYHPLALGADIHVEGMTDAEAASMLSAARARLPLVRTIIEDRRPGREHLHIETRHPDRDQGEAIRVLIETVAGFASWTPP